MQNFEFKNVPTGLQLGYLGIVKTQTDAIPKIHREGTKLHYPCFVQEEQEGQYSYYDIAVNATRDCDMDDYAETGYIYYRELRQAFYGTAIEQAEMTSDGVCQGHIAAVKQAFPKYEGEIPAMVERFNTVKAEFWGIIDTALEELHLTREDLPEQPFNAETMHAWATAHGMTEDQIAVYSMQLSTVSLNLLQNGRNWNELFS